VTAHSASCAFSPPSREAIDKHIFVLRPILRVGYCRLVAVRIRHKRRARGIEMRLCTGRVGLELM